ncbi:MAG: AmmeMemoRadiSam system radical SAM enzyme [Armatimonadetes bacterium]|nr:AmmeMemoRadiSam system radical SAM enzyme [Armatimonadota bacterium]
MDENFEHDNSRREFLKTAASLGILTACSGCPLIADTAVYRGKDYPVKVISNLPKKESVTLKPAKYWKDTGSTVHCLLCPKYCQLREGAMGPCRIRVNRNGKLYSTVYGSPCIVATNSIEQGPIYHVTPGGRYLAVGTAGCNLRCKYCQNWQYSQTTADDTTNYDLPPEKLVSIAKQMNCRGILFTFTEAVLCIEYSMDIARAAREAGLKNAVITAAYVDEEPLADFLPLLDAIRIDLKGFTEKFYKDVLAATLSPVLNSIKTAKASGKWLEVVNMVVPGLNDDPVEFRKMAEWLMQNVGPLTPFHVSRFYPAYKLRNLPSASVSTVERMRKIAKETGLRYVYVGNCPGNDGQNTYCYKCGQMLIHRIGYVSVDKMEIRNGKCRFCNTSIPGVWT